MRPFAGTGALVRFNLRRDRIVIPVCVVGFAFWAFLVTASLDDLYPTAADRAQLARSVADNPAISAIRGAPYDLGTLGGMVAFQMGVLLAFVVGLMSLLLVGRHTRADEEAGRTELVLSAATGRYAPAAAGFAVAALADVLVAITVTLALTAYGLPAAGSLALGAWAGAAGLSFAAVAALSAQLSESARTATGISLATLGAAYVVRAAGDAGDGTLTWLSPIGWGEKMRAFAGERWWPLLLLAMLVVGLLAVAYQLLGRRDFGAGLVPPRPGPATASPSLARPLGLALRLQRGALIGWGTGLLVLGLVYGIVTEGIASFAENEQVADILAQAGGATLVDSYFGTIVEVMALFAAGFAISAALRARTEERAGRAESVLATATSRPHWAGGHLTVALVGTVAVLVAAGLGAGVGAAASTGDLVNLPRLLGSALAQAPAVWTLTGLAFAAFGLLPRATAIAWAALGVFVFTAMFGELLSLPSWLVDLSPYQYTPDVPAVELNVVPLLVLTALAGALVAIGLAGLRRRDVI